MFKIDLNIKKRYLNKEIRYERFFLGDTVCDVVKLTKTVFFMGEMNHYFVLI